MGFKRFFGLVAAVGLAIGLLASSTSAWADGPILGKGTLTVGVERVAGAYYFNTGRLNDKGGTDGDRTGSTSFGVMPSGVQPRLAIDYAIGGSFQVGVTIGGGPTVQVNSTVDNGVSVDDDNLSQVTAMLGLRASRVWRLGRSLAVVTRGGIGYWSGTSELTKPGKPGSISTDNSLVVLTIEPQMVWMPSDHVGFSLMLSAETPLMDGSRKVSINDGTSTTSFDGGFDGNNFGLTAGLFVAL